MLLKTINLLNDDWSLCKPRLLININALIRKVISASHNAKPVITQKEFLISELVQIAMERATIYNAKLLNILNVSQKDGKKTYKIGEAFTELPEEKRQHVTMSIEHEEDVMLGSFADTLVACTAHLTADLEEDAIYKLIGSNYLPL